MDSDSVKHMNLRTEATAFLVEALTVTQWEAFRRVVLLIAEAVEALKHVPEKDNQLPSWLDLARSNRTILLTGDRGSGKTSVLFSLIRACVHPEDIARANASEHEQLVRVKDQLIRLSPHIVWLEPIDMDPLPGPANLLAAILVRIEGAARDAFSSGDPVSRGGGSRWGPAGILDAAPGYREALQDFHRLQTDVTLAWEGNLRERGAHVDPDVYAVEALRAERARLSLNRTLWDTLDELVKQGLRTVSGADPLFVLPVDDVDLNPLRCLEILRLLRMITVPRLFFVVLGNLEVMEVALNLKYSGDFAEVMKGGGELRTLSINPDYVAGVGGKVASEAFRKLLPDAQRVHLRTMEMSESLNYRPVDLGSVKLLRTHATVKPFRTHALLNRCPALLHALSKDKPAMEGKEIKSLRDFILFPTQALDDDDKEIKPCDIKDCFYTARSIFRMPTRHAVDWWHALDLIESSIPGIPANQDDQTDKWWKAVDALSRYLRSAISDDQALLLKDRLRYRQSLQRDPETGGWQLLLPVTAMPQHGELDETPVVGGEGSSSSAKIIVRYGGGWRLFPGESEMLVQVDTSRGVGFDEMHAEQRRLVQGSAFSPHTAAAFRLFNDLQVLGPASNVALGRIQVQPIIGLWAYTEWGLGARKIAFWPVPDFVSFWEHDIFLTHWNEALSVILKSDKSKDKLKDAPDKITQLVYAWMDAGAAVLARSSPYRVKEPELAWDDLTKRIDALVDKINQPFPMGGITEKWLLRLSRLFLPEVSASREELLKYFRPKSKLHKFLCDRRGDIVGFSDRVINIICNEPKTKEGEKYADTMKSKRNNDLDALLEKPL